VRKILAVIGLVALLCLAVGGPVAAAPAGGPPFTGSGAILLNENIGGMLIQISGSPVYNPLVPAFGTFTGHIVRPDGKSTEDSWFEVTEFSGYIIINSAPIPCNLVGDLKVIIHNGGQPNQPIISIRSSDPIFVPGLSQLPTDLYSNVQMLGWFNFVHAK
jgi:hypothetical protein